MEDLVKLVKEMREAQKEYFRTRDKSMLQRSKELEKAVDNTYQSITSQSKPACSKN